MIKELNKKYFANHPLKEFSAARFEYSLYLEAGIEDEVRNLVELDSKDLQDEAVIDAANKPEELLQCMRKGVSVIIRFKLHSKVLEYEEEMRPLIQKRAMTNLQDIFIENAFHFFLYSKENCCDWILLQYDNIRSEYLKSMLCLILGFRGDITMIPFLMKEVERFERWYPEEDYEQGPLLALYEMRERFR